MRRSSGRDCPPSEQALAFEAPCGVGVPNRTALTYVTIRTNERATFVGWRNLPMEDAEALSRLAEW
jgi:hypothetical protein